MEENTAAVQSLKNNKKPYIADKKAFNKDYLIRYFPNTNDRHTNQLIGLETFKQLCGNLFVYAKQMERIERNEEDRLEILLRRGARFVFVRK